MPHDQNMPQRQRTFSWQNPLETAHRALEMSGLDFIRAIFNGEIPPPPIMNLIDMGGAEVEEGRVVFTGKPAEFHYNPIGTVHGGFAATLADSAMGCAVHTMLPQGTGYTTLELSINYLRPITMETGLIYCEGRVIHAGRRVATAEARVTDEAGKLYAHGTTTCAVFTPGT